MNMYLSFHPDATRPVLPNFVSKGHIVLAFFKPSSHWCTQTWAVWRYQNPLRLHVDHGSNLMRIRDRHWSDGKPFHCRPLFVVCTGWSWNRVLKLLKYATTVWNLNIALLWHITHLLLLLRETVRMHQMFLPALTSHSCFGMLANKCVTPVECEKAAHPPHVHPRPVAYPVACQQVQIHVQGCKFHIVPFPFHLRAKVHAASPLPLRVKDSVLDGDFFVASWVLEQDSQVWKSPSTIEFDSLAGKALKSFATTLIKYWANVRLRLKCPRCTGATAEKAGEVWNTPFWVVS